VRFGVALGGEDEISSLLQDRRRELLDNLSRLDWTCEMGLRIAGDCPPVRVRKKGTGPFIAAIASPRALPAKVASAKPQSPLAYIEQRRSHYRRVDEGEERDRSVVQQIVERLHGYYREWRKLPSSPSHPIRLAFLVERDRVASFQSRVENTCGTDPQRRCTILGPWPPYSFV
jgi:hypothetical protein